ncbi:MAG: hypothetical protein HKN35_02600 [Woeseia sp.]|nr:hypothetical protein [Woeseia sp.]
MGSMDMIDVIGGVACRRRYWSGDEKWMIGVQTLVPGVSVRQVAHLERGIGAVGDAVGRDRLADGEPRGHRRPVFD